MNEPRTLDELQENIRCEIQVVTPEVLAAIFRNMQRRVQLCIHAQGGHFTNPQLSKRNVMEKEKLVTGPRWAPDTRTDWPTDCRS
jgi:hypothetical protein